MQKGYQAPVDYVENLAFEKRKSLLCTNVVRKVAKTRVFHSEFVKTRERKFFETTSFAKLGGYRKLGSANFSRPRVLQNSEGTENSRPVSFTTSFLARSIRTCDFNRNYGLKCSHWRASSYCCEEFEKTWQNSATTMGPRPSAEGSSRTTPMPAVVQLSMTLWILSGAGLVIPEAVPPCQLVAMKMEAIAVTLPPQRER
jgi:hypothetical protein